jgi:hypothetical protein
MSLNSTRAITHEIKGRSGAPGGNQTYGIIAHIISCKDVDGCTRASTSCFAHTVLEIDRFKCRMCDISNMMIEMYNNMFEMNNRGGSL